MSLSTIPSTVSIQGILLLYINEFDLYYYSLSIKHYNYYADLCVYTIACACSCVWVICVCVSGTSFIVHGHECVGSGVGHGWLYERSLTHHPSSQAGHPVSYFLVLILQPCSYVFIIIIILVFCCCFAIVSAMIQIST